MRGSIGNKLTVCGDPNYDWAKIATSFLGMDSIIYNLPIVSLEQGLQWIRKLPDYKIVVSLALVLMYGAIVFYDKQIAETIINRIKQIIQST